MTLKYIVTNAKYQNINQILKQKFNISARLQHRLITEKHVLLNNAITDTRASISKNDIITVNLDFEEESENIVATKMNLDIVYEDDAFLILNKPAGMKSVFAVHVCRNGDVRFSCSSYRKYLEVSKGATRNDMRKYMKPSAEERDEFIQGNMEE